MKKLQYAIQSLKTITKSAPRNLLEYNRLLAELKRSSRYFDALQLFTQIHSSHCFTIRPDHYNLSTALAVCANFRDIAFGSQLHGYAVRSGLKFYPHVANTILSLYAKTEDLESLKKGFQEIENPDVYSWTTLLSASTKLGHIEYADEVFDIMPKGHIEYTDEVFDKMPKGNVACWNAVITGCAESGRDWVAISIFYEMHKMGVKPDKYSFACILSLCTKQVEDLGRQVHSLVIKAGYLSKASVINALITMYFCSDNHEDAFEVFEGTEAVFHDQITYNVMIDGLVCVGRDEEALIMFKDMQRACLSPTELTLVSIMSSCSFVRVAQQVHSHAIKLGFESFTSVANSAITMYSSCGEFQAANAVFQTLRDKDLISWNAMISSHVRGNFGKSAVLTFLQMQRTGIGPDEFTFGSLLGVSEFIDIVDMAHAFVYKNGLILVIETLNALVSSYSKCGKITQAHQVFSGISPKNLISWNTVIYGFLLNGLPLQALEHFSELIMSKLKPSTFTLSIVLSLCSNISTLDIGKQIHGYILRSGNFSETSVCNGLITMYSKCGLLDWSLRVFNVMIKRDIISWNSVISAYAQHGQGKEAVRCFKAMQDMSPFMPDQATFTTVLSACSHAGLVDEAGQIFEAMLTYYHIVPSVDQLCCIVDLLGRSGYIDQAESAIESAQYGEHTQVWWALFSACAAHGNLRLGRSVAGILLEKERDNPSVYVVLSNIYATAGCWQEAANVRELIKKTGATKQPGCSWIR
ncbi:Pentatricopeptide repeat-containing protein, partial [Cucurbita argyrosperma subsp. argyrosperma]